MKYNKYYITNKEGKSNCVIRSFCKLFDKNYDEVYEELCIIAKELNCSSYNDIEVFETYLKKNNTEQIDYGKNIKVKDLQLGNGSYAIFCWDKKDFYHMVSLIDNILYDRDDSSLELYTITIYKQKKQVII